MNRQTSCSCSVRSSTLGAKGFYYPNNESTGLRIKKGAQLEILHFVVGNGDSDWDAVLVDNCHIEGAPISEGKGVYWILRKNLV
jgi:hypothetical protein